MEADMRLSLADARTCCQVPDMANGATESPDTGLRVVPWVFLDWCPLLLEG